MKTRIVLLMILLTALAVQIAAQDSSTDFETVRKMRDQVSQLDNREAEIKIRLQQLDYDLKPENIQRQLAGVGSVHPEELREARRKQLQTEKDRLLAELNQVADSRARLQNAISIAESKGFQQTAPGAAALKPRPGYSRAYLALMVGGVTVVLVIGGFAVFLSKRRKSAARRAE